MEHTRHQCACSRTSCPYCGGGLYACDLCGGAEGTLSTDCPGCATPSVFLPMIADGKLDFRTSEGWVRPDGRGTSNGDRDIRTALYMAIRRFESGEDDTVQEGKWQN